MRLVTENELLAVSGGGYDDLFNDFPHIPNPFIPEYNPVLIAVIAAAGAIGVALINAWNQPKQPVSTTTTTETCAPPDANGDRACTTTKTTTETKYK